MDLLIPHSWLKDYLKTDAKPEKIMECLALCGPSIERVTETDKDKGPKDHIYEIEVTTNRVDSASVYGIAREAVAILPRFGIKTKLQPIKVKSKQPMIKSVGYLDAVVDEKLCSRFAAILIRNVTIGKSPKLISDRLEKVGVRSINNIVDISNYIMHDLGQPVHTFDYDKIKDHKMILRTSKRGEKITTLDNKEHQLHGNDIVIEDGTGQLIDLAGIMGGKNSAIDENTKNVLLFVQTYNPLNIRRTTMTLAHRTEASSLFEKGLDPENVEISMRLAIDLFVDLCQGTPEKLILDIYPNPYVTKTITTSLEFINERVGVNISKKDISTFLSDLGFKVNWNSDLLVVEVPSYRSRDVTIPEDVVEEIARLYGYFNLPSVMMAGSIPEPLVNAPFDFENKIVQILKGYGGLEVYTYSMTSKDKADLNPNPSWVLKIKNPLGTDSEYMRLSLAPSLIDASKYNSNENMPYFMFEQANVYLPTRGQLPEEKRMLGIIFANYTYENAKGILESLLDEIGIKSNFYPKDSFGFSEGKRLEICANKETIGQFGLLDESDLYYLEFDLIQLQKHSFQISKYIPNPKYPPQIEDITVIWKSDLYIANIIETIKNSDKYISSVELTSKYEDSRTFRIAYQSDEKTLTDAEVNSIREKILKKLEEKHNLFLKI